MREAVVADIEANGRQQPALAKLKLMPKVRAVLEKQFMHEQLLENEMLTVLRLWLEPLPDGSLPSINIRRPLLKYLQTLPVTTDYIRESRIGRVVMFYYKCDRELAELRKLAADLIGLWSRPILQQRFKSSAASASDPSGLAGEELLPVLEDDEGQRNRLGDLGYQLKTARVPQAVRTTFTAVPPSRVSDNFRERVSYLSYLSYLC
jgi:transcription factor SPN1